LTKANRQTFIYFAYISQYIIISSFYNLYTNFLLERSNQGTFRTLDLLTILLYQPSQVFMLLGMINSLRRARLSYSKH
jgi:hypothetical protein